MNTSFSMDWMRLDGRVALLTGAGGYLGQSLAKGLAAAGAAVALNGRAAERLQPGHAAITAAGGEALVVSGDTTDRATCEDIIARTVAWHGRLDIIVHCAYHARDISLESAGLEDFLHATAQSSGAFFQLVKAGLPALEKAAPDRRGGSSVISIGTMYASVSPDPRIYPTPEDINPPFYGAGKAGLAQLTRWFACNLGPRGIRANCVSPGPFPQRDADTPDNEFFEALRQKNPLGRLGEPDDLCGAVIFLASEASAYITGANLAIDGGWTAW